MRKNRENDCLLHSWIETNLTLNKLRIIINLWRIFSIVAVVLSALTKISQDIGEMTHLEAKFLSELALLFRRENQVFHFSLLQTEVKQNFLKPIYLSAEPSVTFLKAKNHSNRTILEHVPKQQTVKKYL